MFAIKMAYFKQQISRFFNGYITGLYEYSESQDLCLFWGKSYRKKLRDDEIILYTYDTPDEERTGNEVIDKNYRFVF